MVNAKIDPSKEFPIFCSNAEPEYEASGITSPLARQNRVESTFKWEERLWLAINQVANILLNRDCDLRHSIERALELLGMAAGADIAFLWRFDETENNPRLCTENFFWQSHRYPDKEPIIEPVFRDWPLRKSLRLLGNNESLVSSDRQLSENLRRSYRKKGILSFLAIPIFVEGVFWGIIEINDCSEQRIWSTAEEGIFRNAGNLIASAFRYRHVLEQLEQANGRFKDSAFASEQLFWELDLSLDLVYLSDHFTEVSGFEKSSALGCSIGDFIHSEDYPRLQEQFQKLLTGELHKFRGLDIRLWHQSQTYLWHRVSGILLHDPVGSPIAFRCTSFSVHQEKEAMEQLARTLDRVESLNVELGQSNEQAKRLAEEAQSGSRAKSEFLATMSHEIRTPLNGVIGLTDLLAATRLTDKQLEYVRLIQASGKSLLYLINSILDFSKIEAGKMEINHEPFDLYETTESVVGILGEKAMQKNLELCCVHGPRLPRRAIGDGDRIRQVLLNLVGNAVKFTEKGGVQVRVSRLPQAEGDCRNKICFEVIDTGIGIPEDKVGQLFRSFTQVDSSITRKFGGTGLGLAISKQLINIMGGGVTVESRQGAGTTFRFVLPLEIEKQEAEPLYDCEGKRDLSLFESSHILIVTKNQVLGNSLDDQLHLWKIGGTRIVSSTEEALDSIDYNLQTDGAYSLAIVDRAALEDFGKESGKLYSRLPMILVQPLTEVCDEGICLNPSIRRVGKPITASSLFNAVIDLLSGEVPGNGQGRKKEEQAPSGYTEQFPPIRILVAEDNKINQIVVRDILETHGMQATIVSNGVEACQAVETDCFDLILMDCQMPERDGYEATRLIRAYESESGAEVSHIPIVALTANVTTEDKSECLLAGMDSFCSKPIKASDLVAEIRRWVGIARDE